MADILCPNCQRRNEEGRRYCVACGVNLGDAAPKDMRHIPIYASPVRLALRQRLARWLRGTSANSSHD